MKKNILRGLSIVITLAIVVGLIYYIYYFFFMSNNSVVAAFKTNGVHLVIEDKIVLGKNPPKIVDGEILLPIDIVKKYLDKDIYWDEALKKVTITTKNRVIRMKTDELEALVNNKPVNLNMPASEEDGTVYIPIEFLCDFYSIDIQYIKENNVIIIDPVKAMIQIAEPIHFDAVIREGKSRHMPIIKEFENKELADDSSKDSSNNSNNKDNNTNNAEDIDLINEEINIEDLEDNALIIFREYDNWYKVRCKTGEIGYIEKRYVAVRWVKIKSNVVSLGEEVFPWKPEKGKINLVWETMYGPKPNYNKISKIEGLDVISPTWFEIKDDQGNITNTADAAYVEWAHKSGYQIWALFRNNFQDIKATSRFLNNTDSRDNAIRQILSYASLYKLDGINLDFENIYKEDKDALSQFVRELTPFSKEQGLVVSIDVNIPDGSDTWSKCYDHKTLGEIVDYVMVMTYDQYWASSPVAGSVAQLTWVEKNLIKVLKLVPNEKLLLGLPFYTRLWQEEPKAGAVKVTNPKVLTMESVRNMINENDSSVQWDEESGQFYTEFKKDGKTYKIWIEDENSITLKSSLVHKYKLAGTAAWRKTDEAPEIWNVLNKNLKTVRNYQEWQEINNVRNFVYNK